MRSMNQTPVSGHPEPTLTTASRWAPSAASLSLFAALVATACEEPSADPFSQQAGQQQQHLQEVPKAHEFAELRIPPVDVDGLQTYELMELLMHRRAGGSA